MKVQSLLLIIFVIILTAPLSVAQSTENGNKIVKADFLGSISNGIYTKSYFGFSLNIPPEMYVLDEGEVAVSISSGAKMLSKDVAKNSAAWEKAATAEVALLFISEKQPGSSRNSSIGFGALRQQNGISSRMVANVSKEFMLRNPNIRLAEDTKPVLLGNQQFSYYRLSGLFGEVPMNFDCYITIRNGHSLTAVITSLNEESLQELQRVLATIKFDGK